MNKKRVSIPQSFLGGLVLSDWWRLLRQNRFAIAPAYWPRATFITALSLFNTSYLQKEKRLYEEQVSQVQITAPPLFILGHWRSGTTHLHNLLALDNEQFAFPNAYQAANPRIFLNAEETTTKLFGPFVPKKRSVDNMAFNLKLPQEDEFATALTTFCSPFLGLAFPRRRAFYDRFLTFDECTEAEISVWRDAFIWFLKKVSYKYHHLALLLKSPPHTARIKLLLDIFPDARFVHIHRDPFTVFQSTRHLFNVVYTQCYLQHPEDAMEDYIIQQYMTLYDAFFAQQALIPRTQYHELSFEALEQDPVAQVNLVYEKLELPGFQTLEPKLRRYQESIGDYKKNKFPELLPDMRRKIAQKWQRNFELWQYPV